MQTRSSDNDESTIVYSPADDQVEDSNIPGREMLKPATSGARGRKDCEAWLPAINYPGGGILRKLDLPAHDASPVHTPQVSELTSETLTTKIEESSELVPPLCTPISIVERSNDNNTLNEYKCYN